LNNNAAFFYDIEIQVLAIIDRNYPEGKGVFSSRVVF
jgi:hypothetical protein